MGCLEMTPQTFQCSACGQHQSYESFPIFLSLNRPIVCQACQQLIYDENFEDHQWPSDEELDDWINNLPIPDLPPAISTWITL